MSEPAAHRSDEDASLRAVSHDSAEVDGATQSAVSIVPRWVARLFGLLALLFIPWIVYLSLSLPARALSRHYNLSWVGFDLLLLAALSRTALQAYRGVRQVQLPAIVTATLLVVDAWFDVTTAHRGWPMVQSLLLAVVVELPLAALCLAVAYRAERAGRRDSASGGPFQGSWSRRHVRWDGMEHSNTQGVVRDSLHPHDCPATTPHSIAHDMPSERPRTSAD
jgi:multisubunit Na+/H+ antiporter MnhC subunit